MSNGKDFKGGHTRADAPTSCGGLPGCGWCQADAIEQPGRAQRADADMREALVAAGFTSGTIPERVGRMLKLISEFRTERDDATLERDSLREQLATLTKQLEGARLDLDHDDVVASCEAELLKARDATIATLTAERDTAAATAHNMAKHNVDLTKERDQLKHDLANKAAVAGSAMRLKDRYKDDLEASRAEVKELRERVATLHTGHAAGLASMQRTIDRLHTALVEAEGWLDCTNDNEKLQATVKLVRAALAPPAPNTPFTAKQVEDFNKMIDTTACANGCTDAAGKPNIAVFGSRYCRAC